MTHHSGPDAASTMDRPARTRERLTYVDALRGFALLGILVVNLLAFSGPSFLYTRPLSWWDGADRWIEWGTLVLAEGAFYTIFSVLFGWGFGRWMRTRGTGATSRFARRLGWLLVFGLIHLFGIWLGDILTHYALIGFLLLLFAGTGARASALWGAGLWALGVLLFAGATTASGTAGVERWVSLYQGGSLGDIFQARVQQGAETLASTVVFLPLLLGLFLIGAALAKGRVFERLAEKGSLRAWWKMGAWLALAAGLALKAMYAAQLLGDDEPRRLLLSTSLGGPILGFGYLGLFTLWLTSPNRPSWVEHVEQSLAAAGRTALTVYLTQSVVMTLVFYGYGLGLYGRVGPSLGLPLALALFGTQVIVARWWLDRFRFGPVEWLWRSLTYGSPQPWLRSRSSHGSKS